MPLSIDITTAIASKALDGLLARQAATAQNVANANSAHVGPLRITFEDALRDAATIHPTDRADVVLARISQVVPASVPSLPEETDSVQIDQEISIASETSARYAMLVGMLDRTLQIKQLAIRGG